ncbi:MFS transporter [Aerococcus kribbianus]|uniref:MFS transporter n=1 Tax=Aerococcus kribbianus TaxID=2999064 RepID=A0A9X3JER5_9LACT|nr:MULTISPECIES: MFS transporter [unclassified Aerococcus]MCZ0716883.1 MFS transporter [Aerococcus sp. YH-aer221]MCZ0725171.1 MFS transporter [Aerococcus sp. YH-aer222]
MTNVMTKNQKRAVSAAIIASGTDDLNLMFLSFTLSSITAEFALSGGQAGLIASITNLGMLVGGLIFGYLGDRHNKMTMLKLTLLIFSLATGSIFLAPNITILYLLRFIAGIGVGGEYGIALSIIARLVPPVKIGQAASLNGVAGQIGSILAAAIAGLFTSVFGWRGLFLFGLAPLAIVLYLQFMVDDEPAFVNADLDTKNKNRASLSDLFDSPKKAYHTVVLMLMCTVQIAGYFGMMNWLPTMMQAQAGLSISGSSWWMIATILGMSLGMLVFGRCLDIFGPRLMFTIYLLASAVSVYVFTLANSNLALLIAGSVMGFFVNGMFPGYGAVVSRLYEARVHSLANNLILNVGRAVGGFSSVIIGIILESHGVATVMTFLAGLYLCSFVLMLTLSDFKAKNYFAYL